MFFTADCKKTSLVIFDLDGTLYDQRRLRRGMALRMARELPWSTAGRRKIQIIRLFRKYREKLADIEADDVSERQYSGIASELGISGDEVRAVTDDWLLQRPLSLLASCREPHVERFFERLRRAGKIIAVLSDYPASGKLDALGLRADIVVAATDREVNRFKPHPKGLLKVLELAKVNAERSIVIGDRPDRDGECARRAGAAFLLKRRSGSSSRPGIGSYAELL